MRSWSATQRRTREITHMLKIEFQVTHQILQAGVTEKRSHQLRSGLRLRPDGRIVLHMHTRGRSANLVIEPKEINLAYHNCDRLAIAFASAHTGIHFKGSHHTFIDLYHCQGSLLLLLRRSVWNGERVNDEDDTIAMSVICLLAHLDVIIESLTSWIIEMQEPGVPWLSKSPFWDRLVHSN